MFENKRKSVPSNLNSKFNDVNRISFSERNKIRNVTLTKSKLDNDYSEKYLNQYNKDEFISNKHNTKNYFQLIKDEEEKLNQKSNIKKAKYKNKINYKLKDLMIMNPYHYVPKQIIFSPLMANNLINSRFNKTNEEKKLKIKYNKTEPSSFLKTNYNKGKKRKVIETQTISFNDNNINNEELIWRLISRIMTTKGITSFKQAVRYEAIRKVWKSHSLTIERLLVNYNNFKWFFEKERIIDEKVLLEFLSLLKINNEKGYEDFCRKIILIFDDEGLGNIKIKDFFFLMNLTSQTSSNYEKMVFLTYLFEDFQRNHLKRNINIEEIPTHFRLILSHESNKRDLRRLYENLKIVFLNGGKIISKSESNYAEKEKVLKFLLEDQSVKIILKKFYRDFERTESAYKDEINNGFYATMRNSKRMLNIHDLTKICKNDYIVIENVLKTMEQKLNIENEISDFHNYLIEEKQYNEI